MISRRKAILAAIAGVLGTAMPAVAETKKSTLVGRFDANGDGKVDLFEAKKAAAELFDKLDTGKTGALSRAELHGRLSRWEFARAAADKHRGLTKDEYLAVVEQRFKAADANHDGALSSWEFHTRAGRFLARLLY